MRTTLDLPEDLIKQVMKILETKTKSDAIKKALEEVIRIHKVKRLAQYRGKIDLDLDLDTLRGRG